MLVAPRLEQVTTLVRSGVPLRAASEEVSHALFASYALDYFFFFCSQFLGQALKSSRTSNKRRQKPRETKGLEDRAEADTTETESGGAPLSGLGVPLPLGEDADALDAGTR